MEEIETLETIETLEPVIDQVGEIEEQEEQEPAPKKKRRSKNRSRSVLQPRKKSKKTAEPPPPEEEEYEVEKILDWKVENEEEYYLIKWKGWSEEYDQWLKKDDLSCPDLLAEFHEKYPTKNLTSIDKSAEKPTDAPKSTVDTSELQKYIESIWKHTHEDIETAIRAVCNPAEKTKANGIKGKSEEDLNKLAYMLYRKRQKLIQMEKNLTMQMLTRDFRKRRNEQLLQLKRWEDEINQVTQGKPSIRVENKVDLEEPPLAFTYINQCKAGPGVTIPDDPVIGCTCTDGCVDSRSTCCGPMSGSEIAYTKVGRLKVAVGTPIYECNKRCSCSEDCGNRVVQRGSKLKLCIFRTNNGRGWGVKTLELIRKNSFVIEYVGEIITNEEAERRGVQYDAEGRTYLFDLDFNDLDCTYSVDAAHEGNVAHFINHSCDPNLAVFAVWANCLDPNMPRLALFAQRDILTGEELTFDYASSKTENSTASGAAGKCNEDDTVTPRNECRCGAANCRKIMFSLPGNQVVAPFHMSE